MQPLFAKLLLLGLVLLCSARSYSDETVKVCQSKSELECISSPECKVVLQQYEPFKYKYVCRKNLDRCEDGFIQRTGTKESCEAKSGCTFQPGNCYCPPEPGLECRCGGGAPRMCREGRSMLPNLSVQRDRLPVSGLQPASYLQRWAS